MDARKGRPESGAVIFTYDNASNLSTRVGDRIRANHAVPAGEMINRIEVQTDLFEHRAVKPGFINQSCFGQDFALWLQQKLRSLGVYAYILSSPVQEDYGWGFWASKSGDRFWVAISYVGDGPQDGAAAHWIVSIEGSPAANAIRRMLHKPDAVGSEELRNYVKRALEAEAAIRIMSPGRS